MEWQVFTDQTSCDVAKRKRLLEYPVMHRQPVQVRVWVM